MEIRELVGVEVQFCEKAVVVEERWRNDLEILAAEIEYSPREVVFAVFCALSCGSVALLLIRLLVHAILCRCYNALADTRVDPSVRRRLSHFTRPLRSSLFLLLVLGGRLAESAVDAVRGRVWHVVR